MPKRMGMLRASKECPDPHGLPTRRLWCGSIGSPLVATQFAQLRHWSFHYLVSVGIAVSNTAVLSAVFKFKTQDECLDKIGQSAGEKGTSEVAKFRQILNLKSVHLLAFFILVYVGVEVTIGGWIVTFLTNVRAAGHRLDMSLLDSSVLRQIGERRALYLYSALAIGLELVVWLVPSLIGDAVAVSIVGMLLGPIYPIIMNHSARILPRWLLTGAIGWIAGFGVTGSAVIPFMTGALSSRFGITSLQPL
ncbi:hypothetical protein BD779DRAFT_1681366 [Infundibulicybe gibba]|nr:hypothetical protein BD779DRAFT_1681366 [Infundibulicybe gibba]